MAFATQNVKRSVFGNLKVTIGEWTGTVGDASGTLAVSGGRVWLLSFSIQDPSSPTEEVPTEVATASGETSTITIHNHQTVTRGRFTVIHG